MQVERLVSDLAASSSSSGPSIAPAGVHESVRSEEEMDLDQIEIILEEVLEDDVSARAVDDGDGFEARRTKRSKAAARLSELCQVRKKGKKL